MARGNEAKRGELGEIVKMARERRGMSQRDLAERAGITHTTVSRLEAGRIGELRSDALKRLASILDLSTDYMLGLSAFPRGEAETRDPGVAALLALFRLLDQDRRDIVLDFAEFEVRKQLGLLEDAVTNMRKTAASAAQINAFVAAISRGIASGRVRKRNESHPGLSEEIRKLQEAGAEVGETITVILPDIPSESE